MTELLGDNFSCMISDSVNQPNKYACFVSSLNININAVPFGSIISLFSTISRDIICNFHKPAIPSGLSRSCIALMSSYMLSPGRQSS